MTSGSTDKEYSTGFKFFVSAFVLVGVGVLLSNVLWKPLIVIAVLGIPGFWFKYPRDWRKTWPQDFPVASAVVKRVLGLSRA